MNKAEQEGNKLTPKPWLDKKGSLNKDWFVQRFGSRLDVTQNVKYGEHSSMPLWVLLTDIEHTVCPFPIDEVLAQAHNQDKEMGGGVEKLSQALQDLEMISQVKITLSDENAKWGKE